MGIANQLPVDDARNLSLINRRFQAVLPIRKFPMEVVGPNINKDYSGFRHLPDFCPSKYFTSRNIAARVSRIEISMDWRDQGWGNRKGQVWLQLCRPKTKSKSTKSKTKSKSTKSKT